MRAILALLLLSAVFALLERAGRAIPSKPLFRRERLPDFVWWFFTPWVGRTVSEVALFIAIALLARVAPSPAWFVRQPLALQLVETLVAADLLGYGAHRLFHARRLWPIHAIHHSAAELDWLSAARVHPLNEIGQRLVQVIPLYLLGFRGTALAAVAPLFTFYALLIHANLRWDFGPLRYVIASPAFHRWHHAKAAEARDKNFAGLFPWIDLLFGTFHLPRDRQPVEFGIDEVIPRGLLGQLAHPFRG